MTDNAHTTLTDDMILDRPPCPHCGADGLQHGRCDACGECGDYQYAGGFGRGPMWRRCTACQGQHTPMESAR